MEQVTFSFVLLNITIFLVFFMAIFIVRKKNKQQIHYVFLSNMILCIIWCLAVIAEHYAQLFRPDLMQYCEYFAYFGVCYMPISLLATGLIFAKGKINFEFWHISFFVVPTSSMIVLLTNQYHNLFYKQFSVINSEIIYGQYFYFHSAYSYICIAFAMFYLVYFSIKNSGLFSKQAILIIIGTLAPLITNLLFTFNIVELSLYDTPVTFSFAMLCFMFAIFKYGFLDISPIALQNIVDRISDSFVVISENLTIVDYNKTFIDTFGKVMEISRNANAASVIRKIKGIDIDVNKLWGYIQDARARLEPVVFEKHLTTADFDKYFIVEITSILSNDKFIGTIILLKDITQDKKNQTILLEQERLASLGQLIGGIAHNLKTPIMSLAGGIEALKDLADEYENSIGDVSVTQKDHHEIAEEMKDWLEKMKPYCAYMSDIISAVKGQAVQMSASTTAKFTVDELVKRVDLLMKHELKKYHCTFNKNFNIDMNTEIKGEINNLVQVFDNIIMNGVQAYEGAEGKIDFIINRNGDIIEFAFRDYAKGIPASISEKLFKEMITTKGKNGTGLGLYISYATIKGRFGGNMTFTSKEGEGTLFLISIPCIAYNKEAAI